MNKKVLLIGWDSADWNIAKPLMDQGKMPGLQSLVNQGVSGNLATIQPVLSPMLWTSIATGKRAWKHGIHGFVEPTEDGQGIRPITNLSRKTKAIWNILGQSDLKSNVVGWWPSQPAEPINGVMVSNHYHGSEKHPHDDWPLYPNCIHPKRLEGSLAELRLHRAELQNEHLLPFIPKLQEIDYLKDFRVDYVAKVLAEMTSVQAAATALMQTEPWDFMGVYFVGIDHLNHHFMKYHPPRQDWVSEKDYELYKNVVETAYLYHDMMLQNLLKLAGEETTVMLISDHGFLTGEDLPRNLKDQPVGPAQEHSPYGVFCLRGPNIRKGEEVHGASILDVTPTLLQVFDLPVGRDMDGKVLLNCFEELPNVDHVESWDLVEGADGRHPEGTRVDSVATHETIRQLAELGYIEHDEDAVSSVAVEKAIKELQFNLACAFTDANRFADALHVVEKLVARSPDDERFAMKQISCLLGIGDNEKARAEYESLKSCQDRRIERAQAELDKIEQQLQEQSTRRKAEAQAEGVPFKIQPLSREEENNIRQLRANLNKDAYFRISTEARLLHVEGKIDEAIAVLGEAESLQRAQLHRYYTWIADLYLELDDLEQAEAYYNRSLGLFEKSHTAKLGIAKVYYAKKLYFESSSFALASIELSFENPTAHYVYGCSLAKLGMLELAEKTLVTAQKQNPVFPAAHQRLAELYDRNGDYRHAALHREWYAKSKEQKRIVRHNRLDDESKLDPFPAIVKHSNRLTADPEEILVIVSGLPRSGTSMMVQLLQAGGIDPVTDGRRSADDSNPKGYLEDERVKRLMGAKSKSWLKDHTGQAIKIVAPMIPHLPENLQARVLFMQRDVNEILQSQRKMMERNNRPGAVISNLALSRVYAEHLTQLNEFTAGRKDIEVLPLNYSEVIESPTDCIRQIEAFLKCKLDLKAMIEVIDPTLYRERVGSGT